LLARSGGGGHRFGGPDEVVSRLEVEEIEVLKVMVFGRLENVEGYTQYFTRLFVNGVEEVKKDLAVLATRYSITLSDIVTYL
jgi:hypothetical protein